MTLFGQFFDHGLDLVSKGGSGTVFIPLMPDDPLITLGPDGIANTGDEVNPNSAFMVLTRATNLPGPDGILGTSDDVHEATNTTTPFVDQNQTYSSHPSHQVFLREYEIGSDGNLHSTGRLIEGHHLDGTSGGMATWADLKANALKLGILLTDRDVSSVRCWRPTPMATSSREPMASRRSSFAPAMVPMASPAPTTTPRSWLKATPAGSICTTRPRSAERW